jgi:RNA polymerase sigma-70 factor (ECF subfamily)
VLYLVFNEGYGATGGPELIRSALCEEAIRLARLLTRLMPDEPEAAGLWALMVFQHSRRAARVGVDGELVTLEDQDRSFAPGRGVLGSRLLSESVAPHE